MGIKDNALVSLAPMLDDHDVPVRIAVVVTLGDFKDNRTIPLLKKALQDPVPEVDFAAAKVLYQLHDPAGVEFLLDVVSKESKASSGYHHQRETKRLAHVAHSHPAFHHHRHRRGRVRSRAWVWGTDYPRRKASCQTLIPPPGPHLCCSSEPRVIQRWRMRWNPH